MERILITGALGQIGTELVMKMREIAKSRPDSLDATAAKEEWGIEIDNDLKGMTEDILLKLGGGIKAGRFVVICRVLECLMLRTTN